MRKIPIERSSAPIDRQEDLQDRQDAPLDRQSTPIDGQEDLQNRQDAPLDRQSTPITDSLIDANINKQY